MSLAASFRFRLYITGNAPNSERAIANLAALCRHHLPDRHDIEVVDLLRDPQRALSDGVFLTPTLVKLSPGPELRIVGTLGDLTPILASLGLDTV
jgi:circadian clock protein KaiB